MEMSIILILWLYLNIEENVDFDGTLNCYAFACLVQM